ncbi:MAG: glycosyltransferase family 39 protein [Chloroflexi bacterium]|nr:glycosyltransferase family 39 protein [Chloroflexota bacterium]
MPDSSQARPEDAGPGHDGAAQAVAGPDPGDGSTAMSTLEAVASPVSSSVAGTRFRPDLVAILHRRAVALSLAAILLLALGLRLYGVDWDQGGLFHPDERAILMRVFDLRAPGPSDAGSLFDAERSPWNPHWFNYGSLPLYLLKTVQIAASPFTDLTLFDLRIPGRVISALADTTVVALVFLAGRSWYGTRTGLLAALFAALAVIGIQLSHFYAVDTLLTLLSFAAVFFMVRVAHRGRSLDAFAAGLLVGLAIATKFSAVVLGVPALAAFAVYAFTAPGHAIEPADASETSRQRRKAALRGLLLASVAGMVALLLTQPYMLLDFRTFVANTVEQSQMVRRAIDYPYTRQYIDTPKVWYQAWQLGTWGLGPVLGAVTWAGLLSAAVYAWRTRGKTELVLFAWIVPYLAITLWFDVKFMRYMLPVVPFMLLFGARLVWWAIDGARRLRPGARWLAPVLLVLLLAPTAHYALAYATVYSRPHPAQRAGDWLAANAPRQSLVLKEHWEEGVPGLGNYRLQELEMYNPDFGEKVDRIARQLATADYLVLYSNRLYSTISRLPERYPISRAYYEALFSGNLGYEVVYSAESIPGLAGIGYRDDYFGRGGLGEPVGYEGEDRHAIETGFGWADESFTVYDHPRTLILKNTGRLSEQEIGNLIGKPEEAVTPQPGLLLTAEESARQQEGGTWRSIVQIRDAGNYIAWLVWLLAIAAIGLAATPLAMKVFRPLPGRGYLLAKPLGLLLVAFGAWLLSSFGLVGFSRWSVLLALAIVAAVSAAIAYRSREDLAAQLRSHWRAVLLLEALFTAAFIAFLLIRVANPDLWHPYRGGEKPMDFAYLNGVTRSTLMPPYDPWFAGGYLNYYYFGQFVVASLIHLTGVAPQVAYNLAVPALFALTVGAAFTIVYALAEATRRATGGTGSTRGPVYAGLAAAVLVAVAGNIDGLVQLSEGAYRLIQGSPAGGFDYWRSSRMMAPGSPGNEITEFPFFTFLFADLHAHLIAIPFTLLAVGLALAAFLGGHDARSVARGESAGDASGSRRAGTWHWAAIVLLGLTVGALRIVNSWDFPTYLFLAAGAVGGGELLSGWATPWRSLKRAAVKVIVLVAVGYLAFLPFHQHFELFNDGIEMSKTQTSLWRYLAIHAPFLAVIFSYLVWQAKGLIRETLRRTGLRGEFMALYLAVPAALFVTVAIFGYATVVFTVVMILFAAGVAFFQYRSDDPGTRHMVVVTAFVVLALAIGGAVDVVTVKNDIGRMNTVFKFYLQAWILFSMATAYLLWRLGTTGAFSLRRLGIPRAAWLAGLAVLFLGTMVYPVLGTRARIADRFDTSFMGIDGTAFMDRTVYKESKATLELEYDREAIRWLQRNVEGSPVILEGLTDLYRWGNRVSVYTGLPAVVGWDWHQRQQRVEYAWAVTQRRSEVDQIYSTADAAKALALMRKYQVRYVYVGELERAYYAPAGIQKFGDMEVHGLRPVYTNDRVTIYELERSITAGLEAPDPSVMR